ncbi:hypothetical protein [uncultured Treponema sp.]|uniref:hypothetical protein n=1 Tax=uncultured Treponema sp. TaxID=162155 RepID=UPI002586D90F|nr:hypothetical protein [uncultured Treponema sp.]
MGSKDFKREINIYAKIIYREWLIEAIENDDYESFKDCILNLGTQWNVRRNLRKAKPDNFYKNLWDNRKNIQNGTYNWWTGAPSYKSKVCFLINPQYYKLIYDSKNRDALHEENCKPANWQDAADKYYEENNYKSETDEEIFKIDYELWNKEKSKAKQS